MLRVEAERDWILPGKWAQTGCRFGQRWMDTMPFTLLPRPHQDQTKTIASSSQELEVSPRDWIPTEHPGWSLGLQPPPT